MQAPSAKLHWSFRETGITRQHRGAQLGPLLKPFKHHRSMVPKALSTKLKNCISVIFSIISQLSNSYISVFFSSANIIHSRDCQRVLQVFLNTLSFVHSFELYIIYTKIFIYFRNLINFFLSGKEHEKK